MSRDGGLSRADTDTALYSDVKVKRLWRIVRPDASLMATAMCLYEVVRLDSARLGQRVCAEEAAPDWMGEVGRASAALIQAGLLDDEGCIPPHAFDAWIAKTVQRVQRSREADAARKRASRGTPPDVPSPSTGSPPRTGKMSTQDRPHVPPGHRASPVEPASLPTEPASQPAMGGDGTTAHLDAYWTLAGSFPVGKPQEWLDELAATYGMEEVAQALGAEAKEGGTGRTFLSRTQSRLAAEKTRQDRAQERAAQEAKRKADQEERTRLESMPLEQRQANLARLRGLMAEKGIVKPMPGKGKAP